MTDKQQRAIQFACDILFLCKKDVDSVDDTDIKHGFECANKLIDSAIEGLECLYE